MIYVFVAICLFGGVLARGRDPTCPDVKPMENFNKTRFLGVWYAVKAAERYEATYCTSINWFTKNGVDYSYVKYRSPSPDEGSVLMARRDRLPEGSIEKLAMSTDYDSYAVLYLCNSVGPTSIQIMTRVRHPADEVLTKARETFEEKLGYIKLYDVNQWNC